MTGRRNRHRAVLFDFFGTLVAYQPRRSELAYPAAHELAARLGYRFDHDTFVADWDAASAVLEDTSSRSHEEFSMTDAALAFIRASEMQVADRDVHDLGALFVAEWQRHVRPVDGMTDLVRDLHDSHLVGIVSNTHDANMVPSMLAGYGVEDCIDVVVLSVVHGRRKPHHSIYLHALEALGVDAQSTVFVGDSFNADYRAPTELGMDCYLVTTTDDPRVPEPRRLRSVKELRSRLDLAPRATRRASHDLPARREPTGRTRARSSQLPGAM